MVISLGCYWNDLFVANRRFCLGLIKFKSSTKVLLDGSHTCWQNSKSNSGYDVGSKTFLGDRLLVSLC